MAVRPNESVVDFGNFASARGGVRMTRSAPDLVFGHSAPIQFVEIPGKICGGVISTELPGSEVKSPIDVCPERITGAPVPPMRRAEDSFVRDR